jgi:hypothetical protein
MCVSKKQGGMGFRDLHCFNLAMLAKQYWRLIAEPDSLCAKVLRAKYFPSSDILNCQLKKGSSYTWQSIWAGIQPFKRGYMWRVGDGSQINIWDDPWVPCSPNRKIATRRGNIVYNKVSELIDVETGRWDEELIRESFWSVDAQNILNTRFRGAPWRTIPLNLNEFSANGCMKHKYIKMKGRNHEIHAHSR